MLRLGEGAEEEWREDAVRVLAAGLRFHLSEPVAADLIEQCEVLVQRCRPDADPVVLARLLTAQVVAVPQQVDTQTRARLERLERLAESSADELVGALGWVARQSVASAVEDVDSWLREADEVLEVAGRRDDADLAALTQHLAMSVMLERGRLHSIDSFIARERAGAGTAPLVPGGPLDAFDILRSLLDGEVVLAEQQAAQVLRDSGHSAEAALAHVVRQCVIHWLRGRLEDAEQGLLWARREHPDQVLWGAALAWVWIAQGRRAAAESLLATLPDLDQVHRDSYWLSTMTVLAQIAARHGDGELAERVRAALLPFADQLAPVGAYLPFWGTVARPLGLLEERLGLLDEARTHLESAVEICGRIEAHAWLAEAQIELAQFAIRHDIADVPAYDLLAEANRTCEARGFESLAERAAHPARINVFGRFEVVATNGQVATWTSRKARDLVKMLVAARGTAMPREVFMEMLWPEQDPAALANRFAVAVNTIRRALDPERRYPRQHHVVVDGDTIRLELDHLDVDLERFHALIGRRDERSRAAAGEIYARGAFPGEVFSDWAIAARDQVDHAWRAAGGGQRSRADLSSF